MRSLVLAAVLALSACASSKPPPTSVGPASLPADRTPPPPPTPVQGGKLGGKIVMVPTKGLPIVVIRVVFQAGSIDDPKGKEGLTALTAALMNEGGTQELTSAELLEKLFPMAATLDVSTDKELTTVVGAVHKDHLDKYLPLLAGTLTRPRWDPKEFERLRTDALQDLTNRLRTSDDENLGKAALDTLMYAGHPYAHPTLGTVEGLKAITLDDVKAQAKKVFTYDRMMLGVAGAVDDALVERIRQGLTDLPKQGDPIVQLPKVEAGTPKVLFVEKEAASTAVSMGYPYALRRDDPDSMVMRVVGSALGEHRQFNGRLMRELRMKRGLNYGDYAYTEAFRQEGWDTFARLNIARRQQDFTIWLRPVTNENRLFALRAAQHHFEAFVKEGITREEFETARGFLAGYTLLWQETPSRRLGYALDDVYYGTPSYLDTFRKALATMTVEQANAAVKKWLWPDKLDVAVVTKGAPALKADVLAGKPSTIKYPSDEPDKDVLAEDQKFVGRALGWTDAQIGVRPVAEMFER